MKKKEWMLLSSMSFILMASIAGMIMILLSASGSEKNEESPTNQEQPIENLEQPTENNSEEKKTHLHSTEEESTQIPPEKQGLYDERSTSKDNELPSAREESSVPFEQSDVKVNKVIPSVIQKYDDLSTPIHPQKPAAPKMNERGN